MTINVKIGGKRPNAADVIDGWDRETVVAGGNAYTRVGATKQSDQFLTLMEEGLTADETSQEGVFTLPAAKSGTFFENLRLRIVNFFLPEGYEIVREEPLADMREFYGLVRELWNEYQPLLGGRNTPVSTLQIENPFEEEL